MHDALVINFDENNQQIVVFMSRVITMNEYCRSPICLLKPGRYILVKNLSTKVNREGMVDFFFLDDVMQISLRS